MLGEILLFGERAAPALGLAKMIHGRRVGRLLGSDSPTRASLEC